MLYDLRYTNNSRLSFNKYKKTSALPPPSVPSHHASTATATDQVMHHLQNCHLSDTSHLLFIMSTVPHGSYLTLTKHYKQIRLWSLLERTAVIQHTQNSSEGEFSVQNWVSLKMTGPQADCELSWSDWYVMKTHSSPLFMESINDSRLKACHHIWCSKPFANGVCIFDDLACQSEWLCDKTILASGYF